MSVNNNSRKVKEVQSFSETFKIVPCKFSKISRNLRNCQSWTFQLTSLSIHTRIPSALPKYTASYFMTYFYAPISTIVSGVL